jgi:alpha,alpha-trehalose phosphorylase
VIGHHCFTCEEWAVPETALDLSVLAHSESIFALSNGHIGLRGNLDEGEPHGIPGTYLNSFYETRPLPYAEGGYGYPEAGQTLVNVTNGKIIRLLVDDEPFDVRYGELRSHRRVLDLRAGVLRREVEWESPAGEVVRVSTVRLVSFVHRAVAAILYEVEPVEDAARLVVQSELVTNEPLPAAAEKDPRTGAGLSSTLRSESFTERELKVVLAHRTSESGLLMAAGMDHEVEGPAGTETDAESGEELGRVTVATELEPGRRLRVVKYLAYGWSSQRSLPSVVDQVEAALASARRSGWDELAAGQREYLDAFWNRADVEIDGDAELQQAVRFSLFHVLQAGARAEQRAISAKGLTGAGYDGHTFWDTETFVLPVLTYTESDAARDALAWRHATIDLARARAEVLGLEGATFPWRTIRGQECSGYWPAGTAAFHINADIADAVVRYLNVTGDEDFERNVGLELLVETARLWRSLGHHDSRGNFRIDGVTGPDEYGALGDNNVYTNLMAEQNLRAAADVATRHTDIAYERFGVEVEETAAWRDAARTMLIPYDETFDVHPQAEEFTEHGFWDFKATSPEQYPLMLHFPYFDLYRKQVVKQADLVLALYMRGDRFSLEEKRRNFAYYETITVRDSSLSSFIQAVVAAECGHLELAYDYFAEAALLDLDDLHHNTKDGVHLASLAGSWLGAVAGFGGMRDHGGELTFTPRLPQALRRLAFRLTFRGRCVKVDVEHEQAHYALVNGEPLEIKHYGETFEIDSAEPVTQPIPEPPPLEKPKQPAGRAPVRRRPEG